MNARVNGFVICISIGDYSDREEYYFVFPTKPDPQNLLSVMRTIHAETKEEMKGEYYTKIVHMAKDKFIKLFKGAKSLPRVATLRNDAYDKDGDNEWELYSD